MSNDNDFDPSNFDDMTGVELAGTMGAMAGALWTLYSESVKAGFTEPQSMKIVTSWIHGMAAASGGGQQ